MKTKQEWYDELYEYHLQCRHYIDEYKAFEAESYQNFIQIEREAFRMLYRINLETGNATMPEGYGESDYEAMIHRLHEAEEALVCLHNPEEDKIPIWNGDNIPWDRIPKDIWTKNSYDAADFKPHLVSFLQDDGMSHPAVIVMAGSARFNMPEAFPPAVFFQKHGYQAFVLNNRIAFGEEERKTANRAMDLQRAIRLIRARAEEFHVDPERICIMCCSLGNRLAIDMINKLGIRTIPSRVDNQYLPDEIDRVSSSVSAYISLYPATFLSDTQMNYKDFPPVFAVMGNEDRSMWRMMPFFYNLIMNDVKVELHLYDGAGHGFALANEKYAMEQQGTIEHAWEEWTHLLLMWLDRQLKRE